ncbi:MAG TPA: hypothetical protein VJ141_01100, partial [Candidatus Limnocylindrales bacterium]|nr:hypothetical protein [Candidatus Limnocylindrales bacterium]
GGGLGRFIVDGFALQDDGMLVGGAILVALLAVAVERGFSLLERRAISPGLSGRPREELVVGPLPTAWPPVGA